jgi:hypothetical protein
MRTFAPKAAKMLRCEAAFLTLQPTELVHEAAVRISKLDRMTWQDQQHFFATSARICGKRCWMRSARSGAPSAAAYRDH